MDRTFGRARTPMSALYQSLELVRNARRADLLRATGTHARR